MMSPTTIPLTPPSGLVNAVNPIPAMASSGITPCAMIGATLANISESASLSKMGNNASSNSKGSANWPLLDSSLGEGVPISVQGCSIPATSPKSLGPPLRLRTRLLLPTTPQISPMIWLVLPSTAHCSQLAVSCVSKFGVLAGHSLDSGPTTAVIGPPGETALSPPISVWKLSLLDVGGKASFLERT